MRLRFGLPGLLVLALATACTSSPPAANTPDEPKWDVSCPKFTAEATATDFEKFTLECLSDGKPRQLGDLDGRPMVITLWASWCGPCRAEAPAFKDFHAQYGDRINIIGIDTQDEPKAAKAFAADAGWKFPSLTDPDGAVMRSAGVSALPATFFIDANGTTAVTYNEGELTTKTLAAAAAEHFGVKS